MAKKAKTVIVIGSTDLELEKGVVYIQSATFSGPRTAKLFGNRLNVRIVVSAEKTIPQLWMTPSEERFCSDEQCYLIKAEHARYELTRYGLTLVTDLDGNPVEFEVTEAAEKAIADWFDGEPEPDDPSDPVEPTYIPEDTLPFEQDTPPVEEEPSGEVGAELDETDPGEEEDYGYTDEESSTDDEGDGELVDFSTLSRKELVELATGLELTFNSRTSIEELRERVEEAYLQATSAAAEAE